MRAIGTHGGRFGANVLAGGLIMLAALAVPACSNSTDSTATGASLAATNAGAETTESSTDETDSLTTEAVTTPAPPTTIDVESLVLAAASEYYAALQAGDHGRVIAVSSGRCGPVITEVQVEIAGHELAGVPATFTLLSIGSDTASVVIDSAAVPGNTGEGTQFRLEDGRWRWDGC